MSVEHFDSNMFWEDINSLEKLSAFTAKFYEQLTFPAVVLLNGQLGAGKTEFVRQLAACCSVQEKVQSPTFNLMNQYKGKNKTGQELVIFHLDFYRLSENESGIDFDFYDLANGKDFLILTEWPQKIALDWFLFSKQVYQFFFTVTDALKNSENDFILTENWENTWQRKLQWEKKTKKEFSDKK